METPKGLLLLIILWSLAGLITYVLEVVETWHGTAAVPIKLLINVTLDVICASIWPITWGSGAYKVGEATPHQST